MIYSLTAVKDFKDFDGVIRDMRNAGGRLIPKPNTEIKESEFYRKISGWAPQFIEHTRCYDGAHQRAAQIYWYTHGSQGYLHLHPLEIRDPWDREPPTVHPSRYFIINCPHKMEHERNTGNCLNVYKCKLCGFQEEVDSSD